MKDISCFVILIITIFGFAIIFSRASTIARVKEYKEIVKTCNGDIQCIKYYYKK